MSENGFDDALKAVRDRLVAVAKERGVLGQAVSLGDTTILPLSEIKLGFGGGGGQGEGEGQGGSDEMGKGEAIVSLGGGGVRVTPMALVVTDGDEIKLEILEEGGE